MNDEERLEQTRELEEENRQPVLLREALEAERRELEAQKAAFAAQKLRQAVEQELTARGLDGGFADFVTGGDEAESLDRVERFEALFRAGVAREVTRRMQGAGAPRAPKQAAGYTRESLRGMSAGEINAHWDEIANSLRRR